ncbi:hypothetical protein A2U01_0046499 [Trifolium medium]|uniref:Uncharacterized protein n=1 Tax=Trifolium medium TaxID=97028 RepID=A0A392QMY4_9FABA|nr:hypothetical protein [Trifolium medium]
MERKELTLRMGDQERLIKVYKDERDWCFKIDVREKPQNVPRAGGWRMKVQLEDLEEDMSQLTMEEEQSSPDLSHQMKLLNIKEENKALWVRRWGKNHKVATRSKFGVNQGPVKKPFRENLKIRFRKIIDKDSHSKKWINIPMKVKEVKR